MYSAMTIFSAQYLYIQTLVSISLVTFEASVASFYLELDTYEHPRLAFMVKYHLVVSKQEILFMQEREKNMAKTTTPRIPAWSPTVVLTGRHPG